MNGGESVGVELAVGVEDADDDGSDVVEIAPEVPFEQGVRWMEEEEEGGGRRKLSDKSLGWHRWRSFDQLNSGAVEGKWHS